MRGLWTKAKTLITKRVTSPKCAFIDSQPVTRLLTFSIILRPFKFGNIKQNAPNRLQSHILHFLTWDFRHDGDPQPGDA